MAAGNHYRRCYISPETIADLVQMPDGATVKAVNWQSDRQAFVLILEMPADKAYFVEANTLIPELTFAQTVGEDENGGRYIRFSWPEVRSPEDAPKRRQRRTSRQESKEVMATA